MSSVQLTKMMCSMTSSQLHLLVTDPSNKQLLQNYMWSSSSTGELDTLCSHVVTCEGVLGDLVLHPVSCAFVLRLCLGVSNTLKTQLANAIYKQLRAVNVDIDSVPVQLTSWINKFQSVDNVDWSLQRSTLLPIVRFKIKSTLRWITDDMIGRGLKVKETQALIRSSPAHVAGVETRRLLDKIEVLRTLAVEACVKTGDQQSDPCELMLYEMDVCMKDAAEGTSNQQLKRYISLCVPETLVYPTPENTPAPQPIISPPSQRHTAASANLQISSLVEILKETLQSNKQTSADTLAPLLAKLMPLLQAHDTPQNNAIIQQIRALQQQRTQSGDKNSRGRVNTKSTVIETSRNSPKKLKCDRCIRIGRTCYKCEKEAEEILVQKNRHRISEESDRKRSRSGSQSKSKPSERNDQEPVKKSSRPSEGRTSSSRNESIRNVVVQPMEIDADVDRTMKTLTTMVDALSDEDLCRFLSSSKTLMASCIVAVEAMRKLESTVLFTLYERCVANGCALYRTMMNDNKCTAFAVKMFESLDTQRQGVLLLGMKNGEASKAKQVPGVNDDEEMITIPLADTYGTKSTAGATSASLLTTHADVDVQPSISVARDKPDKRAETIESMARKAEESVNMPDIIQWINDCDADTRNKFTNRVCTSVSWHLAKKSPRWQFFGESEPLCLILGELGKECYSKCRERIGQLYEKMGSNHPSSNPDDFMLFINSPAGLRLTITCLHYDFTDKCALKIGSAVINNFPDVLNAGDVAQKTLSAVLDKVCLSDICGLQKALVRVGAFKLLAMPEYRVMVDAVFKTGSNSQQMVIVHGIFIDLDGTRFSQLLKSGFHRSAFFDSCVKIGSGPNIVKALVRRCTENGGVLFAMLLSDPMTNSLAKLIFDRAKFNQKIELQDCVATKMMELIGRANNVAINSGLKDFSGLEAIGKFNRNAANTY